MHKLKKIDPKSAQSVQLFSICSCACNSCNCAICNAWYATGPHQAEVSDANVYSMGAAGYRSSMSGNMSV